MKRPSESSGAAVDSPLWIRALDLLVALAIAAVVTCSQSDATRDNRASTRAV